MSRRRRNQRALTRLELLAVLGALGLLAGVALPVLAKGKPRSDVAVCANNMRQLGMAALMHSMEEGGAFPPRSSTNRWPQQLLRFYNRLDVLRCPADANAPTFGGPAAFPADSAPRSYIINGWNDYYLVTFGIFPPPNFWNGSAMLESAIPYPAQTILFGEKQSDSGHFYVDVLPPADDFFAVEHSRHGARRAGPGGGSNHTMADGSVRALNYGEAVRPTNYWAVTDPVRTNSFPSP